jgi:hypothetical protein
MALMFGSADVTFSTTLLPGSPRQIPTLHGKLGDGAVVLSAAALVRLCILTRATKVPTGLDGLHEIKHDENLLIVRREGSHATPSATATSAAATGLSGRVDISV